MEFPVKYCTLCWDPIGITLFTSQLGMRICVVFVEIIGAKKMESRARASGEQFSTLLEYMESHGDLAKPQPGAQGRLRAERLWQELTNTLNSIGGGVQKPTEKWKKVWADWKSKTKKKTLSINQHSRGTGGGPHTNVTLTALEARLIGIIGAQAVEGHSRIEEQGFNIPVPATQSLPETIHSDLEIGSETIAINQPPSLPTASPRTRPSPEPVAPATLACLQRGLQLAAPLGPAAARCSPVRAASPLPPVPTTPPPSNSRQRTTTASPHSSVATPHRRHLRARRRRALTPFDRATSEFVAIEQRRLQLEERRAQTEARRVEVDNERNHVLSRFANIAEALLQQYLRNG